MINLLKKFFFEEFIFPPTYTVCFLLIVIFIASLLRKKINPLKSYTTLASLMIIVYSYFMYSNGFGRNFNLIWIRAIELDFVCFFALFGTLIFQKNKCKLFTKSISAVVLAVIISSACVAYSFGTANNIIYAMTHSMIFVTAATLVLSALLDKWTATRIFTPLLGFAISCAILLSLNYAYNHPYRLITDIKGQTEEVALLGGINVDHQTMEYIEKLQNLAIHNRTKDEKIYLIDMTGASPGANVILDAGFFGQPWLLGGYPGSTQFVKRILSSYRDTNTLKQSWILVAPEGKRKLDLEILESVGLNFPNSYRRLGVVKTAHRSEIQELWKPVSEF